MGWDRGGASPTWLVQFPALLKLKYRETLQRETLGATDERILLESARR
jgi:hypothetical protein